MLTDYIPYGLTAEVFRSGRVFSNSLLFYAVVLLDSGNWEDVSPVGIQQCLVLKSIISSHCIRG